MSGLSHWVVERSAEKGGGYLRMTWQDAIWVTDRSKASRWTDPVDAYEAAGPYVEDGRGYFLVEYGFLALDLPATPVLN